MRKLWFIIGIVALMVVIVGIFFYFVTAAPSQPEEVLENPTQGLTEEQTKMNFDDSYVKYLIYAIGGWKLHNPPLSDDTPKIKVVLEGDNEVYFSEIINGKIKVGKEDVGKEDMIITTTKQEIIDMITSLDMRGYVKKSVASGKTTLELKASYTALFSKGYLNIYKEITGKSFTGSVIRIFRQG